MKVTSAIANKMLKQLEEEKEYWTSYEAQSCFYTQTIDEDPVIPDYDYLKVTQTIMEIDDKITRIKHAINLSNVNTTISIDGEEMTIDQVLVSMAQKNKRKKTLDVMRSHPEVKRLKPGFYGQPITKNPEYEYTNYDLECVKADFEFISKQIMEMQLALDKHNQTFEFEVDI